MIFFVLLLSISISACKKDESATPQVATDLITNKFSAAEQELFKTAANKTYSGNQNTFTVNDTNLIVKNGMATVKITKLKGVYVWNELANGVYKPYYTSSSISLNQLFEINNEAEIDATNFNKFIEILEKYNNRFLNYTKLSLSSFINTTSKNGQFVYTTLGKTYTFKVEKQGTKFAVFLMNPTDFGLVANLDADLVTLAKAVKAKLPKEVVDSWEPSQGAGSFTEEDQKTFVDLLRKDYSYTSYYSLIFRMNKDSLMYKVYRVSSPSSLNGNSLILKKNGIYTSSYFDTELNKYVLSNSDCSSTLIGVSTGYDPSVLVTKTEISTLSNSISSTFKTQVPANYSSDGDLFYPLIDVRYVQPSESSIYQLQITIANQTILADKTFAWYADRAVLTPFAGKRFSYTIEKINGTAKILAPEIGILSASDFKKLLPEPIAKYIISK